MTSDITIDSVLYQQQQTTNTVASLADDFTQFLNLLTTQLQNQDPLNPMDSSEFTNQLVQFSQVEQQINTNKKMDSLVQLQLANFFGSSLGYVGLDIHYVSSEFNFDGANPVEISYALDAAAERFASAQRNNSMTGVKKIPPPTPINPERSPIPAPTGRATARPGTRRGSSSPLPLPANARRKAA